MLFNRLTCAVFAVLLFAAGCGGETEVRFCFGDSEFCDRVFATGSDSSTPPAEHLGDIDQAIIFLHRRMKPSPLIGSPGAAAGHLWPSMPTAQHTYTGLWLQIFSGSVIQQAATSELPELLDEARALVAALALDDLRDTRSVQLAQGLTSLSEVMTARDPGLAAEAKTLAGTVPAKPGDASKRPRLHASGSLAWVDVKTDSLTAEAQAILDARSASQSIDPIELAWAVTVLTSARESQSLH